MEFFRDAYSVRLSACHTGKYLWAAEDRKSVSQKRGKDTYGVIWRVELVPEKNAIRLKSVYDLYLMASDYAFLMGLTGKKVMQSFASKADSSLEWEPVSAGTFVKLRSKGDNFLRAGISMPPYRNSITHDVPVLSMNQQLILWDVEVVRKRDPTSLPPSSGVSPRTSNASQHNVSPPPPKAPPQPQSDSSDDDVPLPNIPKPRSFTKTTPPKLEIPPAAVESSSPSEPASPVATSPPPRWRTTAPQREPSPPPRRRTPPQKDQSPPPRRRTPPQKDQSPPPRRRTPPQKDQSPPPRRRTPPQKDQSPPPRRRTPLQSEQSPPPRRRAESVRGEARRYDDESPPPRAKYDESPPPRRRASPSRETYDSPPPRRRTARGREDCDSERGGARGYRHDYDDSSPDPTPAPRISSKSIEYKDLDVSGSQKVKSPDIRRIFYSVAEDDGEVLAHDDESFGTFMFQGGSLEELKVEVQHVTGINEDIILCMRNPMSAKLYKMRLALPPNKAPLSIVVVRSNSKFGRSLSQSSQSSRQR